jgi:predicted ArsR family transcriptional regulator
MTALEALKILEREIAKAVDDVPDGWRTTEQWANEWDMDYETARRRLSKGRAVGVVEVAMFRIKRGESTRPTAHYRVIEK